MAKHVQALLYGGFQFDVSSWWGQVSIDDARLPSLLSAAHGTSLKIAPYYEAEGNGIGNVTARLIRHRPKSHPTSLPRVALHCDPIICGSPANRLCSYTATVAIIAHRDRWAAATPPRPRALMVLKVFSGYATCAMQPDNWHSMDRVG
jgi:hypothetical protein